MLPAWPLPMVVTSAANRPGWIDGMTSALARTDAQMLYLVVDLGEAPSLRHFQTQTQYLASLSRHCERVVQIAAVLRSTWLLEGAAPTATETRTATEAVLEQGQRVIVHEPVVVRTSVASPWVTVLGTLVERSQIAAYSVAALLGLQRLLRIIMGYQSHLREIRERDIRLDQIMRSHAMAELRELGVDVRSDPRLAPLIEAVVTRLTADTQPIQAADRIAPIVAAEMIDPNDPRAIPPA